MSLEGRGESLLVLPPLGPNASQESDMDRKVGELATKNWGMRKEDSSVYVLVAGGEGVTRIRLN